MNTAKIRPEYQEIKYSRVQYNYETFDHKIVVEKATLDDEYQIVDTRETFDGKAYVLAIPYGNGFTLFPEEKLYDIKVKTFNIKEIEKELLEKELLKFESIKRKGLNLGHFLINAITDYNINNDTLYADSKKVQTKRNKRRSLGDWFRICKYYFPDCTLADVATLLYITYPNNTQVCDTYRSSYCNTIKKRVFYHNGNPASIYSKSQKDEYNKTWKEWTNILN